MTKTEQPVNKLLHKRKFTWFIRDMHLCSAPA